MEDLFPYLSQNILPTNGEVYYYPEFFSKEESNELFRTLFATVNWKQEPIKLFGKEVMQPRLTAWYADEGIAYSYSGITMTGEVWNKELLLIKRKVEELAGVPFNSALLNLYRHGNDSMGWHRDNESELGINPVIASVSFGANRKFQVRTYKDKSNLLTMQLNTGSCLLMKGETQHYWEHRVPKITQPVLPRLNITFRRVINIEKLE
jgi:alkylated DNA repair dioxygenase AlkB